MITAAVAAWAFIKKIATAVPWWVWLAAAVLGAAFFYGEARYNAGVAFKQGQWDEATTKAEEAKRQFAGVTSTISTSVETKVIERTKIVKEKGDVIIKRVPVYIPTDSPDLPAGFRLLHDAAVTQTDPPDSARIASSAPVSVATASTTIFGNYTAAHINALRLEGWQEWWSKVKEACEKTPNCELLPGDDGVTVP